MNEMKQDYNVNYISYHISKYKGCVKNNYFHTATHTYISNIAHLTCESCEFFVKDESICWGNFDRIVDMVR